MKTAQECWQAGVDTYTFCTPDSREEFRQGLAKSGVEFKTCDVQEQVAGFTLFVLAVKRITPTVKQQLGKFPKGD